MCVWPRPRASARARWRTIRTRAAHWPIWRWPARCCAVKKSCRMRLGCANEKKAARMKKPPLGRGLADLLGHARTVPAMEPSGAAASTAAPPPRRDLDEELMRLPLDLLQRGRYQPRLD